LYYQKQKESISPQLQALKKEEKITKPPLGRAPFNQSNHSGRDHFNQLGNMLSTLPPLHSLGLLPPPLCMPHTLSSRQRPTHPSTPLVHSGLGCGLWPQYGHLETTQAVPLKLRSSVSLQQFVNSPAVKKTAFKVQRVSVWPGRESADMLYQPACQVAYKRIPGEPGLQSAASNRHRHTLREPNLRLHHLDTFSKLHVKL
jgi:hypothetical protein